MDFQPYMRRAFEVSAVEVTRDNIAELADLVGTLSESGDGTPFIQADKKKAKGVGRVWPGYFITKMDNRLRCYTPKAFRQQFDMIEPEAPVLTAEGAPETFDELPQPDPGVVDHPGVPIQDPGVIVVEL
jgi:hypothetical protein